MNRSSRLLTIGVIMLTLAGCSAEHFYNEGVKAAAKGNYDKAVENYAKATAKEPDNEQYRQALAQARLDAAKRAVDEGIRLAAAADLTGAQAQARKALGYDPNNAEAAALDAELRERVAAAEQLRAQALGLAAQGSFDQAITTMQQALTANRTMPNGQADLQRIRQQAAAKWIAEAQTALAAGQLDAAEQNARTALTYNPSDGNAQRILQAVANYRAADQLVRQAQTDIAASRFDAALAALDQANRLAPGRPDIGPLMQTARTGMFQLHVAEGKRLSTLGDHAGAIREFQIAKAVGPALPGMENIDALIAGEERQLAGRYRVAADAARDARQWGNALVNYVLADLAAPRAVPDNLIRQSAAEVAKRLGYPVAVLVGSEQPRIEQRQLVDALEAALVRDLSAARPLQVTVLTRQETQQALARRRIRDDRFFGARPVDTARELADTVGGVVVVNVTHYAFTTDRSKVDASVKVRTGVRPVDNPAFDDAKRARDKAAAEVSRLMAERDRLARRERDLLADPPSPARSRKLDEVRRDLAKARKDLADAEAALAVAERTLAVTPRRIDQPLFADVTIPGMQHTRTLRLLVGVKFIDAATGLLLADQVVDASVAASDVTHPGSPPRHIAPDPLLLPDDAALAQQAALRAILGVTRVAEVGLFAWPRRYDHIAAAAVAGPHSQLAVEALVDRLFVDPVASPPAEKAMADLVRLVPHDARLDLRGALMTRFALLRRPVRLGIRVEEHNDGLTLTHMPGPPPAGLRLPARVLTIDGKPVYTLAAYDWLINTFRPGSRFMLEVRDRNQQMKLPIAVE